MGSISTPRLYRKNCGTYFVRVLFYEQASSSQTTVRKRRDVRLSLRTKNPSMARRIGAWVNARLAGTASMTDRRDVLNNLKTWTAEGLTVNGEDDRQNFQKFYDSNPEFKEAWLERIRRGGADQEAYAVSRENPDVLDRVQLMKERMDSKRAPNPTRASVAITNFVASKNSAAENTKRTLDDKTRLLVALFKHLAVAYPALGDDPLVDQIETFHIDSFCSATQVRKHRDDVGVVGGMVPVAAATALKKMSDLRSFFACCLTTECYPPAVVVPLFFFAFSIQWLKAVGMWSKAAAVGNAAAQRRVVHGRRRCAAGASSTCPWPAGREAPGPPSAAVLLVD